jgi:hypothetical protein
MNCPTQATSAIRAIRIRELLSTIRATALKAEKCAARCLGMEGQEFMEVPGRIRILPAVAALVASACASGTLQKSGSGGGGDPAVSAGGAGGAPNQVWTESATLWSFA